MQELHVYSIVLVIHKVIYLDEG